MKYEEIMQKLEHLPFRLEFGNLYHITLRDKIAEMRKAYLSFANSKAKSTKGLKTKLDKLITLVDSFLTNGKN